MFALVCSKCQTELQVPNSLAGCLIRCHECDGVTRAPRDEPIEGLADNSAYAVRTSQETPQHSREINNFVRAMEEKARKEAEQVPYSQRKRFPVDLILGVLLVGSGLVLMLVTLLGGGLGGMFITFVFGILLPLLLIFLGAMCLTVWRMM